MNERKVVNPHQDSKSSNDIYIDRSSNTRNRLLMKELYSNICDYTRSKGIPLVTARQLNKHAADIATLPEGESKILRYFCKLKT